MSLIVTIINSYEDNQVKKKWAKEIFKMRLRLAPSSLDCCKDKKATYVKDSAQFPL